jgi:large subunit ribosomal protein L23
MMTDLYNVLLRPHVTEKTSYQNSKLFQYVFDVAPQATKVMVKDAVEKIFEVEVVRVNIINVPAKATRRGLRNRRRAIRRSSYKKAIVTLAPGNTISIFEGVK